MTFATSKTPTEITASCYVNAYLFLSKLLLLPLFAHQFIFSASSGFSRSHAPSQLDPPISKYPLSSIVPGSTHPRAPSYLLGLPISVRVDLAQDYH